MGEPGAYPNTEPNVRYLRIITHGKIWHLGGHKYVLAVKDNDVIRQVKSVANRHTPVKVVIWCDSMPLVHDTHPSFKKDKTKEYLFFHLTKPLYTTWYALYRKGELPIEIMIPVKGDGNNKVV
jgi:hypothetical protein